MLNKVSEYISQEGGDDSGLAAKRPAETAVRMPQALDAGTELGDAWRRLGNGERAVCAYRRLLEQDKGPIDALVREQLEAQVGRVVASDDPAQVEPLRNPWLE